MDSEGDTGVHHQEHDTQTCGDNVTPWSYKDAVMTAGKEQNQGAQTFGLI